MCTNHKSASLRLLNQTVLLTTLATCCKYANTNRRIVSKNLWGKNNKNAFLLTLTATVICHQGYQMFNQFYQQRCLSKPQKRSGYFTNFVKTEIVISMFLSRAVENNFAEHLRRFAVGSQNHKNHILSTRLTPLQVPQKNIGTKSGQKVFETQIF